MESFKSLVPAGNPAPQAGWENVSRGCGRQDSRRNIFTHLQVEVQEMRVIVRDGGRRPQFPNL